MPKDFKSSNNTRNWCVETFPYITWAYCLADAAIPDMRRYSKEQEAEGTPFKHKDWDRTHINWIRRTSPLGKHYVEDWERMNNRAKTQYNELFGVPERTSRPPERVAGILVDKYGNTIKDPARYATIQEIINQAMKRMK